VVRRLALLTCLLVAVSGCGGDDTKEAEQTVRDFVEALNTHDADRYCDELITKEFLEKTTFSTGDEDKARASCKREFENLTGLRVKLNRIEATKVEGDKATVTAVLTRQGQRIKQRLLLEKEDGDWKLAGAAE
jgi:ketosteroid isomerase-like protein